MFMFMALFLCLPILLMPLCLFGAFDSGTLQGLRRLRDALALRSRIASSSIQTVLLSPQRRFDSAGTDSGKISQR
jgi:hypothetical protein